METVTILKKEYKKLLETQVRYGLLKQAMTEDLFLPPPIKDVETVISAFRTTGKYSKNFIASLEKGLERSSYFNAKRKWKFFLCIAKLSNISGEEDLNKNFKNTEIFPNLEFSNWPEIPGNFCLQK